MLLVTVAVFVDAGDWMLLKIFAFPLLLGEVGEKSPADAGPSCSETL